MGFLCKEYVHAVDEQLSAPQRFSGNLALDDRAFCVDARDWETVCQSVSIVNYQKEKFLRLHVQAFHSSILET